MFVYAEGGSTANYSEFGLDAKELGNVNYYKRYIAIETPDIHGISQITVTNVSCSTGNGRVGVFTSAERLQNTHVYHCTGRVFNVIPPAGTENFTDFINWHAVVRVESVSYGRHNYNMSRSHGAELEQELSYIDTTNDPHNFDKIPDIRYFNIEHHLANQDILKTELNTGSVFLGFSGRSYDIILGELIKDKTHTEVLCYTNSNYVLGKDANQPIPQTKNLIMSSVMAAIAELLLNLLYIEVNFKYCSVNGFSGIEYKSPHPASHNNHHVQQILSNSADAFGDIMLTVDEFTEYAGFEILVAASLGNVRTKFISFDGVGAQIYTHEFSFDIGKSKNEQHEVATNWVNDISVPNYPDFT